MYLEFSFLFWPFLAIAIAVAVAVAVLPKAASRLIFAAAAFSLPLAKLSGWETLNICGTQADIEIRR
jgi:hypothetical protein